MRDWWKCIAIGILGFITGFIVAVWVGTEVEKTHIKYGHTPYIDKNSGLMWQGTPKGME